MKERPILNEEWESINLSNVDRPFREKTEEERQLEYFGKGEAIDLDYMVELNPHMKYYFETLLDAGVASQIDLDFDGEFRRLVQLNEEPTRDPWDRREWLDNDL